MQHALRLDTYSHLQQVDNATFEKLSSGNVQSIMNADINLLEESIIIDDSINGNSDGYANPGELVYLNLPLINYGSDTSNDVVGILTSNSDVVNIIYGISQYENISSGELADH